MKPENLIISSSNQMTVANKVSNEFVIITIEEIGSMCNFCSTYKASVFSNGKVEIKSQKFIENNSNQGEKFIKKIQTSNKQFSNKQVQEIIQEFENANFFELADNYTPKVNCPESLSDSNTIHLYYKNENQSKTINYYQGCQGNEDLKKLAKLKKALNRFFNTNSLLINGFMSNTNVSAN